MPGDPAPDIEPFIEHFFRAEYGKMVAVLTAIFRFENLEIAEDIVQDTLVTACRQWGFGSVPENPHAWLMTVAKNKALNLIKHEKRKARAVRLLGSETDNANWTQHFDDVSEEDSTLRMMFACCHPALKSEAQIVLVLKILCGFSVAEIARSLLIAEEAAAKRIYRARERIKKQDITFDFPDSLSLDHRLEAVCTILYLLFNEGYRSTRAPNLIRKDLCLEAMRLCRVLTHRFSEEPRVFALLSLMCFHTARFESRIDENGALIIFQDQDRTQWNQPLIQAGLFYLSAAARGPELSAFHIEASIAAEHCLAPSFEKTNWQFIRSMYDRLYTLKPHPIVKLNQAIVTSKLDGNQVAIKQLLQLHEDGSLSGYSLLDAALAELLRLEGQSREALKHYRSALNKELSSPIINHIRSRIEELESGERASGNRVS